MIQLRLILFGLAAVGGFWLAGCSPSSPLAPSIPPEKEMLSSQALIPGPTPIISVFKLWNFQDGTLQGWVPASTGMSAWYNEYDSVFQSRIMTLVNIHSPAYGDPSVYYTCSGSMQDWTQVKRLKYRVRLTAAYTYNVTITAQYLLNGAWVTMGTSTVATNSGIKLIFCNFTAPGPGVAKIRFKFSHNHGYSEEPTARMDDITLYRSLTLDPQIQ